MKKNMITRFYRLPLGARFEFRGRRYEKLALSLAADEERCGNIFRDETEVVADPPPGAAPERWLLPARTTPERPWTDFLSPAPATR